LFFLDEVTALAAGHRPCFECRRADARAFAAAFAEGRGLPSTPRAADMDSILHVERVDGRAKRTHRMPIDDLPDGAFVALDDKPDRAFAVRGASLLEWTPAGYRGRRPRPKRTEADVLTPPATVAALAAGYRPAWHPTAGK
jgi:hypothetical protein